VIETTDPLIQVRYKTGIDVAVLIVGRDENEDQIKKPLNIRNSELPVAMASSRITKIKDLIDSVMRRYDAEHDAPNNTVPWATAQLAEAIEKLTALVEFKLEKGE
jgi:hypothetical protein